MQKPKWLRFPRIHLSTAVLVALAAGAMLGVNLRQRPSTLFPGKLYDGLILLNPDVMGWPVPCYVCKSPSTSLWQQINERYLDVAFTRVPVPGIVPANAPSTLWLVPPPSIWNRTTWWTHALTPLGTDVLTALGVMLLVAVMNEFRVRRVSRAVASTPASIPQEGRTQ